MTRTLFNTDPYETKHVVAAMIEAQKYPMLLQVAARIYLSGADEVFVLTCCKAHGGIIGNEAVITPSICTVVNYVRDFRLGLRTIDKQLQRLLNERAKV